MTMLRFLRAATFGAFVLASAVPATAQEQTTVYRGAFVWTGEGFAKRDVVMRHGRLADPDTAGSDAAVIDADGRYIVPAYGNAHAHMTPATEEGSRAYTDAGVFYVMNPSSTFTPEADRAFFARPATYDVAISQGSITVRGGHPEAVILRFARKGRTRESFIGDAFHYGETPTEIDAALDLLSRQGANFVKAVLFHSDAAEARRKDPRFEGQRGLTTDNFRYLVKAAWQRGLSTVAHVESAQDLETAAAAGATMAMHLPGFWLLPNDDPASLKLSEAQADLILDSGMGLVPTYGLTEVYRQYLPAESYAATVRQVRPIQVANLRLLRRNGARFLIGNDGQTLDQASIFGEVEYLDGLGVFPRPELLRILFTTGSKLFPSRRIGCFEPGCEADFLILRDNPLTDIKALRTIETRVKAGAKL